MECENWCAPLGLVSSSSDAHGDLDEVVVLKRGVAGPAGVSPLELIGQGAESDTAAHKLVKRDPAVRAVAPHDAAHGLRAQVEAHGDSGLLQLVALHHSTAVPVEGGENILPSVQDLRQLLELGEAHGAGKVPIQHVDHQSAGLQAEGLI